MAETSTWSPSRSTRADSTEAQASCFRRARPSSSAPPSGNQTPKSSFPTQWREGGTVYPFDGQTNYATNLPGTQEVALQLAFPAAKLDGPDSFLPAVQGTSTSSGTGERRCRRAGQRRKRRRPLRQDRPARPRPLCGDGHSARRPVQQERRPHGHGDQRRRRDLRRRSRRPLLHPGQSQSQPPRSRGSTSFPGPRWFGSTSAVARAPSTSGATFENSAGEDAKLVIVDSDGNTYDAIGWLHKKTSDRLIQIKVDDRNGVDSIGDVPMLSSAGKDSLILLFRVPKGRKVKALMLGKKTIATMNLEIN